jgi:hypothetical protein
MNKTYIIGIVLLIVVGGGAFFGGMKYQQSRQRSSFLRQGGVQGTRTGVTGANRTGFRPVAGEIIASDDKSITVKLQDGSSKIVLVSDKTEISKAASATKDDLKVGEKVSVFGTDNSDGSVTAQNIQLNPIINAFPSQPPNQ